MLAWFFTYMLTQPSHSFQNLNFLVDRFLTKNVYIYRNYKRKNNQYPITLVLFESLSGIEGDTVSFFAPKLYMKTCTLLNSLVCFFMGGEFQFWFMFNLNSCICYHLRLSYKTWILKKNLLHTINKWIVIFKTMEEQKTSQDIHLRYHEYCYFLSRKYF